jgi:hypothetical protein
MGGIVGSVAGSLASSAVGSIFGEDSGSGGYQQPMPQFTPYNITTPYGSSKFDTVNKTASYTLSPELQAFRDQYYKAATAAMPTAEQSAFAKQVGGYGQSLFGNAMNLDTNQMTSDYYNKQLGLLQPGRAQQESQLADTLFKQGRTGVGVGMTNTAGQTGYINPEQFSLLSAREAQNAEMQLAAEDRARAIQQNQMAQGIDLYNQGQTLQTTPYNTMNTLLGLGTNLERLGQDSLTLGSNIGSNVANAQYQAGNLGINQQNAMNTYGNQQSAYWGNMINQGVQGAGGWGAIGKSIGNVFQGSKPYSSASDFESRMGLPSTTNRLW